MKSERVHWLYTKVLVYSITHASLVYWHKDCELGLVWVIACLGITEAMSSMRTTAMETIPSRPVLHTALLSVKAKIPPVFSFIGIHWDKVDIPTRETYIRLSKGELHRSFIDIFKMPNGTCFGIWKDEGLAGKSVRPGSYSSI